MLQVQNAAYDVLLSAHVQNVITLDDVLQICQMNGWQVYSYKQARQLIDAMGASEMTRNKSFVWRYQEHTIILYCDELSLRDKILCLCHEIGHIKLGHLPGRPYTTIGDVQELEANVFAYELICPTLALRRCGPWRSEEIRNVFPVPHEGAAYYIAEMRKQLPVYNIAYDQILDQYRDMIAHIRHMRRKRSFRITYAAAAAVAALLLLTILI